MSCMKSIQKLLIIENVLGVYRNTPLYPISVKLMNSASWAVLFCIINAFNMTHEVETKDVAAMCYQSTAKTLMFIISGYYYRNKFQSLLLHLDKTHQSLRENKSYMDQLNRVNAFGVIYPIALFSITNSYRLYIVMKNLNESTSVFVLIWNVVLAVCEIRAAVEHDLYLCLIFIIFIQLKFLRKTIEDDCKKAPISGDKIPYSDWCAVYSIICESAELINSVFGFSMTYYLSNLGFIQIFTIYNFIVQIAKNTGAVHWIMQVAMILTNIGQVFLMSLAGQRVCNESTRLQQSLASTRNSIDNMDPCYKAVCELQRLVARRPPQIELFGSIQVRHSLLPAVLMFFMSYLLLALQITNIV